MPNLINLKISDQQIAVSSYGDLYAYIEDISEVTLERLSREDKLGSDLHFRDAIPPLMETRGLLLAVGPYEVQEKFTSKEAVLKEIAANWLRTSLKIDSFNASSQNPLSIRNGLISEAKSLLTKTIDQIGPTVQYIRSRSSAEIELELKTKYEEALEPVKKQLETSLEDIEKAKDVARKSSEAAQLAAGQSGVSAQSRFFEIAAEENKTLSGRWLNATLGSVLIFIIAVFAFDFLFALGSNLLPIHRVTTIEPWISYVSTKILSLGAISVLIVISRKNYVTHRHNGIINEHRANALNTYEALVSASGTDSGKELILQAAAQSIFLHQDTNIGRSNGVGNSGGEGLPKVMLTAPLSQ